jgi:hypothetical protein
VSIVKRRSVQIEELVDKMLSINKRLCEIGDKRTDERAKLEEETSRIDKQIDEIVYKLYDIITSKEGLSRTFMTRQLTPITVNKMVTIPDIMQIV